MRIFLLIIILFIAKPAFSDQLSIPFSCWPIELQAAFAEQGKKLDLSGVERTDDSWGYIENKGSEYTIYTYRATTKEDFDIISKIVFKIEEEKGG